MISNESSRLASRMDWIVESEISVARVLSLSLSVIRETLNSIQSTIHPSLCVLIDTSRIDVVD